MSPQDNELLTLVQNGASMGLFLKSNFWFPATLSCNLERDGQPKRVTLLGKNFVAWRSTDGRVGFFDEECPHRRVSLTLARNEDNALRCIFHGWKYSVEGKTVEVPTEPHQPEVFCKHVPLKHYPVREAGGIVWAWIDEGEAGKFPDFEFNELPDDHVYAVRQDVRYNWVQDLEGGMDSAHVSILHSGWLGKLANVASAAADTAPTYEFETRSGGFRYAAIRKLAEGNRYVRVNQFVAPWYSFICPDQVPDGDRLCLFSVPTDDRRAVHWMVRYNPHRPIAESYVNPAPDRNSWPPNPPGSREEYWGQDRDFMKDGDSFTGFHHLITEDFAVAESQGEIADRSKEFLNSGDRAVIMVRNILLDGVRKIENERISGEAKPFDIDYHSVRPTGDIIGPDVDWRDLTQ